jgi:SNF2 family DNA or RNA helicase
MGQSVQVLGVEDLWGASVASVILTSTRRLERVPVSELKPIEARSWTSDEVAWRAAIGLVWRGISAGEPIAVARGAIEALPHQLAVLERALSTEPLRLLLADEVGLGKTIEAGLVISELKARGHVQRILVVVPKGVQLQWLAEMSDRFGEQFVLVGPGGVPLDAGIDPWTAFDQVICSLDTVKPLRTRPGWNTQRIAEHNRQRIEAIRSAGWDLVVIDEAHHLAGSDEAVSRHRLGRALAEVAPRVLLLTATPHSGKSDAFARLLGLLDQRFLHGQPIKRSVVAPLVVRTEKRDAVDSAGRFLFQPRTTRLITVPYGNRTVERSLYEGVSEYVRHGYRRAVAEHRTAAGFLLLLMQRLVSSSTAATLSTLERRRAALALEHKDTRQASQDLVDWDELEGEEQQALASEAELSAGEGERLEVETLIDMARKAMAEGIDAKAAYLLELLGTIARAEGDPTAKAVVFTEFVPTQLMLLRLLSDAGITAVGIDGSMSIYDRRTAQEQFNGDARVLVSTDAGGEGINLQFAHTIINYDLPWSPTRIEQRIGRVDRIGQHHPVTAYNLVLEASVDARVIEVLQQKLDVILRELGADKTSEILQGIDKRVESVYGAAILTPERLEAVAEHVGQAARSDLEEAKPLDEAMGPSQRAKPRAIGTTLSHWLRTSEVAADRIRLAGQSVPAGVPEILAGEPVPLIHGALPGWWTLWETEVEGERDAMALFLSDRDSVRPDLAERMWTQLADAPVIFETVPIGQPEYERLRDAAVDHGYRRSTAEVPTLALRLAVRVES